MLIYTLVQTRNRQLGFFQVQITWLFSCKCYEKREFSTVLCSRKLSPENNVRMDSLAAEREPQEHMLTPTSRTSLLPYFGDDKNWKGQLKSAVLFPTTMISLRNSTDVISLIFWGGGSILYFYAKHLEQIAIVRGICGWTNYWQAAQVQLNKSCIGEGWRTFTLYGLLLAI